MEAVIGAVLLSEQKLIPLPRSLIESLFGLGMARIFTLGVMIASMARRQYQLRPEKIMAGENQSLLENGERTPANGYGGINGSAPATKPAKDRQAGSVGWFDYFAGFRVLFPYLW